MTATLRLVPIGRKEARRRLEKKGALSPDNPGWYHAEDADQYLRPRNVLCLKLCTANEDGPVDVEDGTVEHAVIRYASRYQDGSTASIVSLGRNFHTGIKWNKISRALCDVSLAKASPEGKKIICTVDLAASPGTTTEASPTTPSVNNQSDGAQNAQPQTVAAAFLSMRKPPGVGNHGVHLDGVLVNRPLGREVPLQHGSIISLYGPDGFAYEVLISQHTEKDDDDSESSSPKKRKTNPPGDEVNTPVKKEKPQQPPTPLRKQSQRGHELVIGECTCAMCMDILVKSMFAIPCLHPFCEECSANVTNAASPSSAPAKKGICPTCRGSVDDWRPARHYDNIIWGLALQGCIERDDAEYYLERREQSGENAPTKDETDAILNNLKGEDGESKSEVGMNRYLPSDPSQQSANNLIRTLPPLFPMAMTGNAADTSKGKSLSNPQSGKSSDETLYHELQQDATQSRPWAHRPHSRSGLLLERRTVPCNDGTVP